MSALRVVGLSLIAVGWSGMVAAVAYGLGRRDEARWWAREMDEGSTS